mmetsp:Transcript_154/g.298  ORF Transcript_154/g.298 Transcript_154/m.298 type:complete len:107 (-) Transcript_154:579-899(-)
MGWTGSPPYFCVLTETVIDLVNERLGHWDPPPHPLEKVASTPPPAPEDERPISYVPPPTHEDKLARHIEPSELPPAPSLRRILLHVNELVFRPNERKSTTIEQRQP